LVANDQGICPFLERKEKMYHPSIVIDAVILTPLKRTPIPKKAIGSHQDKGMGEGNDGIAGGQVQANVGLEGV